jgi:hypothetical protein
LFVGESGFEPFASELVYLPILCKQHKRLSAHRRKLVARG